MSAAIDLREDFSAEDLRALARLSRDSRQCRRLLALAAVAEGHSRAEAAKIGGMERQTLRGAQRGASHGFTASMTKAPMVCSIARRPVQRPS